MTTEPQHLTISSTGASSPKIITIGVYGYDEDYFFHSLVNAGVDLFCDLRQRRGVRGSRYAFANSKRLQARLQALGISYLHLPELAPTKEIRALQHEVDKAMGTARQKRSRLDDTFVEAYCAQVLENYSSDDFLDNIDPDSQIVALFCVERDPEACHRSLVANKLEEELALTVEHLLPAA